MNRDEINDKIVELELYLDQLDQQRKTAQWGSKNYARIEAKMDMLQARIDSLYRQFEREAICEQSY